MPVLGSRRRQAHVAATLAVAAVALPSAVQSISGSRGHGEHRRSPPAGRLRQKALGAWT